MKTLIIHVSDIHLDIHLDGGAGHLMLRAEKIADAALSVVETYEEVHVVATGDLINRGAVDQFPRAEEFLKLIADRIEALRSIRPLIVTCPGNHDCNFSGDQSVRNLLLKAASTPDATGEVIAQISTVLKEYFDVEQRLSPKLIKLNRWHSEVVSDSVR